MCNSGSNANQDLVTFLKIADLEHLYDHFIEEGIEIKYLLIANEEELKCLTTRLIDRIKLRNAIQLLQKDNSNSCDQPSSTPEFGDFCSTPLMVIDGGIQTKSLTDNSNSCDQPNFTPELGNICSTPLMVIDGGIQSKSLTDETCGQPKATLPTGEIQSPACPSTSSFVVQSAVNTLTDWVDEEWQFVQEIGPLLDRKPLKELLEHTTFGKALLLKEGQPLTSKSRKTLVQLIVEHQLRILPSIKDTIRQDVWTSWANEICSLFKGEHADIYYVPYTVTERQALPASGLLHNRLITHRRFLKPGVSRKRSTSGSSTSSEKDDKRSKRVRPLPPALNLNSSLEEEDPVTCIQWLEASSSPHELVLNKWQASFKARHELLKEKSIDDYFSQFLSLRLPTGHKLLANDFDKAYPLASATFEEHFPLVKKRLLELLVEKGSAVRAEPAVTDLLDLATAGEEQGSLAALRCIPYVLKQIAPVIRKVKGKKWKPSRSEVSSAFITHVSSPGDVERCIEDRFTYTLAKGIAFGIFIIAVGPSWSTITQYEVVVSKSVRYQFSEIKPALTTAIKIYFALDIEYTADAAPCWMFVQRAFFKVVTKFDVLYDKSVTLRELIKDCVRFS